MTITLKTLPQATAQEVFDQVAMHMLTQGEQSMDADRWGCMYRGDGGLKCAAGCLIADDEYRPEMEDLQWVAMAGGMEGGMDIPEDHCDLIMTLQGVHDMDNPLEWRERLVVVASNHQLDDSVVRNFVPAATYDTEELGV